MGFLKVIKKWFTHYKERYQPFSYLFEYEDGSKGVMCCGGKGMDGIGKQIQEIKPENINNITPREPSLVIVHLVKGMKDDTPYIIESYPQSEMELVVRIYIGKSYKERPRLCDIHTANLYYLNHFLELLEKEGIQ